MRSELISRKIESLRSMDGIKSTRPDMPVAIAVQEAINLYDCCKHDREKLVKAGLDWSYAEDLPVRAKALSELHSICTAERIAPDENSEEWKEARMQARELRNELLHICRNVFDDNPEALRRLKLLSRAPIYAELIQSLSNLAEFGSVHRDLLESKGIDMSLFDKARAMAGGIPGVYSMAKVSIDKGNEGTELRNRAFYHLREAVAKVRKAGRDLFNDNEKKYKGYLSAFIKNKKRKSKRGKKR